MEALRASVLTGELLLVAPHTPAGLLGLHLSNRRLSHADGQAAKHPQNQRRIGGAHPAAILVERYIQRMVQTALNDPVAALEFDPAQRVQLLQS